MNLLAVWLQVSVALSATFFARIASLPPNAVSSTQPRQLASCTAPEYRQFDFWLGDWDAFDMDKPNIKVAHVRVDRILDGCVLREDYQDTNGLKGQSFSLFDTSRKVWHQSWVTNRGQLLILEGKVEGGDMVLRGEDHAAGGRALVRGTWKAVDKGVRETAVTSTDGGKTWKPWFDLLFRPHRE
jgi:hypothetical protein